MKELETDDETSDDELDDDEKEKEKLDKNRDELIKSRIRKPKKKLVKLLRELANSATLGNEILDNQPHSNEIID